MFSQRALTRPICAREKLAYNSDRSAGSVASIVEVATGEQRCPQRPEVRRSYYQ